MQFIGVRWLVYAIMVILYTANDPANAQSDYIFIDDFEFHASDGPVDIEDGDSFWMGYHRVRLFGVDTVETTQVCTSGNQSVDCYALTMDYMLPLLNDPSLHCRPLLGRNQKPRMSHGRYVAICYVNGIELNRQMVRDGWAVSYQQTGGTAFDALEGEAAIARRGLHQFQFDRPIDARRAPSVCPE